MSVYGYFQTDVLIKFFILLRRAEVITWENFVPVKQDPGSTKEGTLSYQNESFCMHSQDVIYEEFLILPGYNGTMFDVFLRSLINI